MTFGVTHPSGLCRLHDAAGGSCCCPRRARSCGMPHSRCAGLRVRDIRRGAWWSGTAHDQDVLVVERDEKSG